MVLLSGSRLGPYEVIAPLGAGGMGEVYRARDTRLGREVAIKVLPPALAGDADRLRRFEKEAQAVCALSHPNIVTLFEVGREGTTSYMVMELVEGRTLREVLADGPLRVKKILTLAPQIAEGLARAHENGIVHRDLKPENVMVTKDGFAKVVDFGLAKLARPEPEGADSGMATVTRGTEPGTVMGTVGYMSPEQASAKAVDYRSDQFSFGAILYEMATGRRAFQRGTAVQTLAAIVQDEPDPIGAVNPRIPAPFAWIAERCLAKDPTDRFSSTRDLARDLASVRDHLSEATFSGAALAAVAPRKGSRLLTALALSLAAVAVGIAIVKLGPSTGAAPSFRRITFRSGGLGMARFAPDGQTVIYSATWGATRDVYLMRIGDPESRLLYSNTDLYSVSDTGELAIMPGTWTRRPNLLARVPLAGGAPREVVEDVAWANADWAPKGRGLAIIRSVAGRNRLEFPIGKILYETNTAICCPRFSPDGRTIAFFEVNNSVRTLQTDGTGTALLSSGWDRTEGVPCWARGGKEVWFTAGRKGESPALFRVDRSGRLRLIARVPGNLVLYDVFPDGRVLVAHVTETSVLMWGRTDGDEAERDLSWLDRSWGVDLAFDGRSILSTEIGEGGGADAAMYLRPTDGSPAKRLGEGMALALSPDGKWALGTKDGRLFVLPTGPGELRQLTGPSFQGIEGGDFSPDGRQVVFSAREKGGQTRLYVQEVDGGLPRSISPEGVTLRDFGDSVSPDGRLVLGLPVSEQATLHPEQRGEPRLYRLDGGGVRSIPGLAEGELPVQWSADGEALYVYRRGKPPADVRLLNIVTGHSREWRRIQGVLRLLIARDGSSYAYNSRRVASELDLVEGLK